MLWGLAAAMVVIGFGAECGRHFSEAVAALFNASSDRMLAKFNYEVIDAAFTAACKEISEHSDFSVDQLRSQFLDTVADMGDKEWPLKRSDYSRE
jgi:hypothetical protein